MELEFKGDSPGNHLLNSAPYVAGTQFLQNHSTHFHNFQRIGATVNIDKVTLG